MTIRICHLWDPNHEKVSSLWKCWIFKYHPHFKAATYACQVASCSVLKTLLPLQYKPLGWKSNFGWLGLYGTPWCMPSQTGQHIKDNILLKITCCKFRGKNWIYLNLLEPERKTHMQVICACYEVKFNLNNYVMSQLPWYVRGPIIGTSKTYIRDHAK